MKPGPKPGPPKPRTLLFPRRCRYCHATFVPERPQDKDAKFCCPNHRKQYWRYGGLPFDKMKDAILKEVRKELKKLFAAHWNESVSAAEQARIASLRPPVDKYAYLRTSKSKGAQ